MARASHKLCVTVGMCDLLIPTDAKVEHGTKLASALRAHHRFAVFFRENCSFYPRASATESDWF